MMYDCDCERKGWSSEALPCNGLVVAWSEAGRLTVEQGKATPVQGRLFYEGEGAR
jgi:hypothetical protein